MEASVASLRVAAAKSRPVATAETRLVEVPDALADLFPDGGIRRGSTMTVGPITGGCSLALSLIAATTRRGSWAAVVGLPSLGLVAAAELGVDLERLALVRAPAEQWPVVVAALIDGFDLLLVSPPARVRGADARRLVARVRERGTVMVVLDAPGRPLDAPAWPEPPDVRLTVTASSWEGLGAGHGLLQCRRMEVVSTGRRAAGRQRRRSVWLPGPPGGPSLIDDGAPGRAADGAPRTRPAAHRPDVVVPDGVVEVAG